MMLIIASLSIALATGLFAYSGQEYYKGWFEYIESDLRDKLRRLRINLKNLRRILFAWFALAGILFLILWIALGLFVLGILFAAVQICLPWYIVRRMAEKRKEQIEDQLADAS